MFLSSLASTVLLRTTAVASIPLALGLWAGLAGRRLRRRDCARILTFHGTPAARLREYERQLRYLRRQFDVVPLPSLLRRVVNGEPLAGQVALTFDDGRRSNVQVIYPLLRRLGLPATFFVCPGLVEEGRWLWNVEARQRLQSLDEGLARELARELGTPVGVEPTVAWMKTLGLARRRVVESRIREASPGFTPTAPQREEGDLAGWAELRALDPAVVTLGSHTLTHPILSRLATPDVEQEVAVSRTVLETRIERPVELFAYPNGDLDARVRACVARHYRGAVTTEQAWVQPGSDPLLLPRLDAPRGAVRLCWNLHREMPTDEAAHQPA